MTRTPPADAPARRQRAGQERRRGGCVRVVCGARLECRGAPTLAGLRVLFLVRVRAGDGL
jgi:hypothetical protein